MFKAEGPSKVKLSLDQLVRPQLRRKKRNDCKCMQEPSSYTYHTAENLTISVVTVSGKERLALSRSVTFSEITFPTVSLKSKHPLSVT